MKRPLGKFFFLIILLLPSCSFFKTEKKGSVKDYQNGIVFTEEGKFRVGLLPPVWQRQKLKYRAVLLNHQQYGSSIGVDAFCRESFDDVPLRILTNQLFYGMTEQKRLSQTNIMLDGREAQRTVLSAELDGAPFILDAVVLKMNVCVFDFYYVTSPGNYRKALGDFERFFKGFRYLEGPDILNKI